MREGFLEAGSSRATTANDLLPAVDGGYSTFPACERFLEVEFNHCFEVIAVAGEDGVGFLLYVSISNDTVCEWRKAYLSDDEV